MKRKEPTTSMGTHLDGFIAGMIAEGRYRDEQEVIRAGLLLLEEDEAYRLQALRSAIQEGLDSGVAQRIDPEEQLKKFKADRASRLGQHGSV